MNKRLYRAIHEASELRAFIVLLIVMALRAWRYIQSIYIGLPSLHDMIHHTQRRTNLKVTYYLYPAHWIGNH